MLDGYTQAQFANAAIEQMNTALALRAPHVLMRPAVFPDGSAWCALYGEDLQQGVAGFGDTPEAACFDFDKNWTNQKLPRNAGVGEVGRG